MIADHLKIVSETRVELEDILQGKTVLRKGIFLEDRGSVIELGEPQPETDADELVAPETSKEEDK